MYREYTDANGKKHDIDIYESPEEEGIVYVIHKNGAHFLDLVRDEEGRWIDKYKGGSEDTVEYGQFLDLIYPRSFTLPKDLPGEMD